LIVFLTGGARSGKSTLAVTLAERADRPVRVIATAEAVDAEMERRIRAHRASRPSSWAVVEEPLDLVGALRDAGEDVVLVDCITLWLANLLAERDDEEILALVDEAVAIAAGRAADTIIVSNEVGSGIVPMDPVGRRFRDLQGWANQRFAAAATRAYLVVAGQTVALAPSTPP